MSPKQFIDSHVGRYTDVDGAYGAQCWDLWSAYASQCFGIPEYATSTTDGYAQSVYTGAWNVHPELRRTFARLPASSTGRYGDVAFWRITPGYYPGSHVAIVIRDYGSKLYCLSQNPTPPTFLTLSKVGLLGYFRPRITKRGGTEVVSNQDVKRIAEAVWDFVQNGVKTRDRLQGIDNAANGANNKAQQLVNELLRRDSGGTHDGTKGDMFTRLAWVDNRVRKLAATLGRTDDAGTGNHTKADIYTRQAWTGHFVKLNRSDLQKISDKLDKVEAEVKELETKVANNG